MTGIKRGGIAFWKEQTRTFGLGYLCGFIKDDKGGLAHWTLGGIMAQIIASREG